MFTKLRKVAYYRRCIVIVKFVEVFALEVSNHTLHSVGEVWCIVDLLVGRFPLET